MDRGGVRVALERYVSRTTVFWQGLGEYSSCSLHVALQVSHAAREAPTGEWYIPGFQGNEGNRYVTLVY
jgi:hypothetical protein